MIAFMMAYAMTFNDVEPFHVFHTVTETRHLANQSSRFQNVILQNVIFYLISQRTYLCLFYEIFL